MTKATRAKSKTLSLAAALGAIELPPQAISGREYSRAFRGLGGHAMRTAELFHLLHELAHIAQQVKDQFMDIVEEPERKHR